MNLEELRVYQISMEIGEAVWGVVMDWRHLERDTLGKQWIRSADSIAANISEGYGRYSFKENKHFLYYARGSFHETRTWLTKAEARSLVSKELSESIHTKLNNLGPQLNNYIRSIGKQHQVHEPEAEYSLTPDSSPLTPDP